MQKATAAKKVIVVLAAVACFAAVVPAHAGSCPGPRTCRNYELSYTGDTNLPFHWPIGSSGLINVPYRIWPYGSPFITPENAISAIRGAAATWELWNPHVHFDYRGIASRPPVSWGELAGSVVGAENENVVGFSPGTVAGATTSLGADSSGHITGFEIVIMPGPWQDAPCQQKDNSCTPEPKWYPPYPLNLTGIHEAEGGIQDLRSVVFHEFGHTLGLNDLFYQINCMMTMRGGISADASGEYYEECPEGFRHVMTPALGDVLGLKALYPWTCPKPDRKGRYPSRYKFLCPKIRIFYP
ncbi:MAG: hypothetical protein WDA27_06025 [Actinomycetota bacterium]